jgi:fluoride ion exporter CrcB/FEX
MYRDSVESLPPTDIDSPKCKDRPLMVVLYNIFAISAFSVAGVAARIALLNAVTNANFFPQATTISVNLIGSFIMGIFVTVSGFKDACPYMYNALTVGFCGSFTTFSSWIYSTMHNGNALIELATGLTIPFAVFALGGDLGSNFSIHVSGRSLALDKVMVYVVALCAVLTLVLLSASNTIGATGNITDADIIACALGPIGALTRWLLGKLLNDRILASPTKKTFRLGTLTSNVVAVIITGALAKYGGGTQWTWCIIMGICGSLSTVSSWVADTVAIYESLSKKWAYFYCTVSVSICVLVMIPFA